MTSKGPEQGEHWIVVKRWDIFLTAIGMFFFAIVGYATIRAELAQHTKTIDQLQEDHVTKEMFKQSQDEIQRRLGKIEDKLDAAEIDRWKQDAAADSKKSRN